MTDTLTRDIAALHTAHTAGTWQPTEHETALATDLAHAHWTGPVLRAALRRDDAGVVPGPLAGVLETAAAVLEAPGADGSATREALLCLRVLIDRMAHEEAASPLSVAELGALPVTD